MAETMQEALKRLEGDYQSAGRNNPTDLANLRDQVKKFFGENTPQITSSTTSSREATPKPTADDEGGGSGGRGASPGEFGNLNSDEKSTLAAIARGAGLVGMGVPGFGMFGQMVSGILGIDNVLGMLGVQSRGYAGLSAADLQGITDQLGAYTGATAKAANAQSVADYDAQIDAMRAEGNPTGDYSGKPSVGAPSVGVADNPNDQNPGGVGMGRDAASPTDTRNADPSAFGLGGPEDGGAPGGTTGGPTAGDNPGGPSTDNSGDSSGMSFAKGGVRVVNKPTNIKIGDAGTEAIVGIPGHKLNPEIMQTLALLLQQIRGDK